MTKKYIITQTDVVNNLTSTLEDVPLAANQGRVLADMIGGSTGSPTGTVSMFAGSVAPQGWLICNGQAVSRSTYSGLFSVIGTTYGGGDGSTTFNVPNLVNKTVRGSNSLGATGGSDSVTLATTNLPSHTHGGGSLAAAEGGSHSHSMSGASTGSAGGHVHNTCQNNGSGSSTRRYCMNSFDSYNTSYKNTIDTTGTTFMQSAGDHTHTLSASIASGGSHSHSISGTSGATGGGASFAITNPYVMLNFIIKT